MGGAGRQEDARPTSPEWSAHFFKKLYKAEFQAVYGEAYGLADRFRITLVPWDSAAHEAGLRVGDEILAANGKPMDAGDATAENWAAAAGEYKSAIPLSRKPWRR
ncbi:MAG: PDZ domain-containing protein [Thermodesulfobacteriota bacterium]